MKLSELKCNPKNPRTITKEKLESLKKSLKSIPELMKVRPIVIDENNVISATNPMAPANIIVSNGISFQLPLWLPLLIAHFKC